MLILSLLRPLNILSQGSAISEIFVIVIVVGECFRVSGLGNIREAWMRSVLNHIRFVFIIDGQLDLLPTKEGQLHGFLKQPSLSFQESYLTIVCVLNLFTCAFSSIDHINRRCFYFNYWVYKLFLTIFYIIEFLILKIRNSLKIV
jgi:hypothetical protein